MWFSLLLLHCTSYPYISTFCSNCNECIGLHSLVAAYAPVNTSQPFAPVNASQPFAPVNASLPFAPVNTSQPFAPVNTSLPFAPINASLPFAPVNTSQPFAPINASLPFAVVPFISTIGQDVLFSDVWIVKHETDLYFETDFAMVEWIRTESEAKMCDERKDTEEMPDYNYEYKAREEYFDIDEDYEGGDANYEMLFNQKRLVKSYFKDSDGNGWFIINVRGGSITVSEGELGFLIDQEEAKRKARYEAAWCDLYCFAALIDPRIRDNTDIRLDIKVVQQGYNIMRNIVGEAQADVFTRHLDAFQQSHYPYNTGPFDTKSWSQKTLKYSNSKHSWVQLKAGMFCIQYLFQIQLTTDIIHMLLSMRLNHLLLSMPLNHLLLSLPLYQLLLSLPLYQLLLSMPLNHLLLSMPLYHLLLSLPLYQLLLSMPLYQLLLSLPLYHMLSLYQYSSC